MHSDISIRDYIVSLLHVETNESGKQAKTSTVPVQQEMQVEVFSSDEPGLFQINLHIGINKNARDFKKSKYRIELLIKARFSTHDSEVSDHAVRLGVSSTYSLARGVISQATASFVFGKFILPIVNVNDLMDQATQLPT